MRQLNNKDVRQRRRAVRKLFELDDPIAIDAFIPLLDDSDEWFRGKALIAIQKWATMKDLKLAERLTTSRRTEERILACRIAPRIGKSSKSILKKLSSDNDPLVKLNAWKIRLEQDDLLIKEAILVEESGIRILAIDKVERMAEIEDEIIKTILKDKSSRVRKKAVLLLRNRPELNSAGKYDEIIIDIAENDKSTQIDAIIMLIESGRESKLIREKISIWIEQENPQMVKMIVDSMKDKNLEEISELMAIIINSSNDKLISGILRRNKSAEANELRKKILLDEKRSDVLRARIIEDLFGKNQDDQEIMTIIRDLQQSENESISSSANMFIKTIGN